MRRAILAVFTGLFFLLPAAATAQTPAEREIKRLQQEKEQVEQRIAEIEAQITQLNVEAKYLRERLAKMRGVMPPEKQSPLRFSPNIERAMLRDAVQPAIPRREGGPLQVEPKDRSPLTPPR